MSKVVADYLIEFGKDQEGKELKHLFSITLSVIPEKTDLQKLITIDGINHLEQGGKYVVVASVAKTFDVDEVLEEVKLWASKLCGSIIVPEQKVIKLARK